jgi:hypothetical protein
MKRDREVLGLKIISKDSPRGAIGSTVMRAWIWVAALTGLSSGLAGCHVDLHGGAESEAGEGGAEPGQGEGGRPQPPKSPNPPGIQCAERGQGPLSPAFVRDDDIFGQTAWSYPQAAVTKDGFEHAAFADFSAEAYTHYLVASDFGFAIPTGVEVLGIVVEVRAAASVEAFDASVRLLRDGTLGVADRAFFEPLPLVLDDYIARGDIYDRWDEAWTPAQINDPDFGAAFAVYTWAAGERVSVDHIRLSVVYRECI